MGNLPRQLLPSKPNQVRTRDHGQVRQYEDGQVIVRHGISDGDGGGNERPENVHYTRGLARGPEDDLEEVQRVDARPAALARGLDAGCDRRGCSIETVSRGVQLGVGLVHWELLVAGGC